MLLVPENLAQYREEMRAALEENRIEAAAEMASRLSSGRVAQVLREAPRQAVIDCLKRLDVHRAGRVLGAMPPEYAGEVLMQMDHADALRLVAEVPPDRVPELLAAIEHEHVEALLADADQALKTRMAALEARRPGSAGAVMSPHFLAIERGKTIGQTLDALLAAPPEVERSSYVYVVDPQVRPVGVLSVKDLMRYDPASKVEEAMNPDVIAVHMDDAASEAAKLIRLRRFTMLPVVDATNILVGVITFDDAMDILAENIADQFAAFGAGTREESFFTPPMGAVRRRLPWMGANVFLNLGAVAVITSFEGTIAQVAILAAFLPMITDMGGNVGIQSLSVAIRSIALGEVRLRDFWRAARKELAIGLVNGAALGVLFAVVATFWQGNPWIGVLAGIALGCNVLLAGVVGGTIPFLIKRLGRDPAMMTGPILTTITDITGVSIYLGLCTVFLSALLAG